MSRAGDLPSSLFRREALEHRERDRKRRDVVRIAPGWTRWAFWLLVAGFLGIVAATSALRIEAAVGGIAAPDPGGRLVVLASVQGAQPRRGDEVRLEGTTTTVATVGEIVDPEEAWRRHGVRVPGSARILVAAGPGAGVRPGETVQVVTSERMIVALVPGLRGLLVR